ncbi:hypothetical protein O6H91_17G019700 [Diphasiastrum complanatum]|uniref:Uncharacterized protein n=1 Tax=Diphasiastrum complanatum TaxID=34168 RepID=A0ACC2B4S0_DIPCM|nr:hypothetical protein O6H91_17G019700 [Diphasiastrum complanatum]
MLQKNPAAVQNLYPTFSNSSGKQKRKFASPVTPRKEYTVFQPTNESETRQLHETILEEKASLEYPKTPKTSPSLRQAAKVKRHRQGMIQQVNTGSDFLQAKSCQLPPSEKSFFGLSDWSNNRYQTAAIINKLASEKKKSSLAFDIKSVAVLPEPGNLPEIAAWAPFSINIVNTMRSRGNVELPSILNNDLVKPDVLKSFQVLLSPEYVPFESEEDNFRHELECSSLENQENYARENIKEKKLIDIKFDNDVDLESQSTKYKLCTQMKPKASNSSYLYHAQAMEYKSILRSKEKMMVEVGRCIEHNDYLFKVLCSIKAFLPTC